jgi:hypothetical protein
VSKKVNEKTKSPNGLIADAATTALGEDATYEDLAAEYARRDERTAQVDELPEAGRQVHEIAVAALSKQGVHEPSAGQYVVACSVAKAVLEKRQAVEPIAVDAITRQADEAWIDKRARELLAARGVARPDYQQYKDAVVEAAATLANARRRP